MGLYNEGDQRGELLRKLLWLKQRADKIRAYSFDKSAHWEEREELDSDLMDLEYDLPDLIEAVRRMD